MQIAVIEFARHVLGWDDAHSAEFAPATIHPVIHLMPDQRGITAKGGTMRLGQYPCMPFRGKPRPGALRRPGDFRAPPPTAMSSTTTTAPILRPMAWSWPAPAPTGGSWSSSSCRSTPFFLASQFHPEFLSRPNRPHPLFRGFVPQHWAPRTRRAAIKAACAARVDEDIDPYRAQRDIPPYPVGADYISARAAVRCGEVCGRIYNAPLQNRRRLVSIEAAPVYVSISFSDRAYSPGAGNSAAGDPAGNNRLYV